MPVSANDAARLAATAAAASLLPPRGAATSSRRRSANRWSYASRKATERYSSASRESDWSTASSWPPSPTRGRVPSTGARTARATSPAERGDGSKTSRTQAASSPSAMPTAAPTPSDTISPRPLEAVGGTALTMTVPAVMSSALRLAIWLLSVPTLLSRSSLRAREESGAALPSDASCLARSFCSLAIGFSWFWDFVTMLSRRSPHCFFRRSRYALVTALARRAASPGEVAV